MTLLLIHAWATSAVSLVLPNYEQFILFNKQIEQNQIFMLDMYPLLLYRPVEL